MSASAGGLLARPPIRGRSSPRKGSSCAQKWVTKRGRLRLSVVGKTLSRKRPIASRPDCAKEFRRLGVNAGLFTFARSRHVQDPDLMDPAPIPYRGRSGVAAKIHTQSTFIVFSSYLVLQL